MAMMNTFQVLAAFLEGHGTEVEGRAVAEPPAETRQKLELLAAGKLPEPEQQPLFEALGQNPEWVAWLAREVKGRRSDQP